MRRLLAAILLVGAVTVAPAQASTRAHTLHGIGCRPIPMAGTALPFGVGEACPGVRPGALLQTGSVLCSFNFMITDGINRYMGTAGHCILEGTGVTERTWSPGAGQAVFDADGNRVGEFAYAILQDPKDFALIRLDPGVSADPAMCHFGGPTGVNADITSSPVVLEHTGNGVGIGDVVPARTSITIGMPDPDAVFAEGAASPGDSGSGVISSDGRAVGVLVTVGVNAGFPLGYTGFIGITRIGPQLDRASAVMHTPLQLVTAPLV